MSITTPKRPLVREASSKGDYRSWVREYIEARAADETCYPHHEENYPLVVDCPICGGPSMIDPLSMGDAPSWTCKTSYAPGHAIRLEDGQLKATNYRDEGPETASESAPWLQDE